jgi:hypothetical protein
MDYRSGDRAGGGRSGRPERARGCRRRTAARTPRRRRRSARRRRPLPISTPTSPRPASRSRPSPPWLDLAVQQIFLDAQPNLTSPHPTSFYATALLSPSLVLPVKWQTHTRFWFGHPGSWHVIYAVSLYWSGQVRSGGDRYVSQV